jgi:hypothetical protein
MLSKKIKPTGKIYTKDVVKYLNDFRQSEAFCVTLIYDKKGLDSGLYDHATINPSKISLKVSSLVANTIKSKSPGVILSSVFNGDFSRQIVALHWFHDQGYVLVTQRDVMAATFEENPGAAASIRKIIAYAGILK